MMVALGVGWCVWIPAFAGMTGGVGGDYWITLTLALSLRERGVKEGVIGG